MIPIPCQDQHQPGIEHNSIAARSAYSMSNQVPQQPPQAPVGVDDLTPGAFHRNFFRVHVRWLGKSQVPWDIASWQFDDVGHILKPDRTPRHTPGFSLTYEMPPQGFTAFIQFRTTKGRAFAIPFGTSRHGEHWCDFFSFAGPEPREEAPREQLFPFYQQVCDARENYYPMTGAVVLQAKEPSREWEIAIDTAELNQPSSWRAAAVITFPTGIVYGFNYSSLGPNFKGEWNGVWGFLKPPTGLTKPPTAPLQPATAQTQPP